MPQKSTLNISNQEESGSWASITDEKNISDAIVTEEVFNVGFDHGKSPKRESYAYIVVPGISEKTLTENIDRSIQILSNTIEVQAARNEALGVTQIVFYTANSLKLDNQTTIALDSPGIIMLKTKDNKVDEVFVSDPTRTLSHMTITLKGEYSSASGFEAVYKPSEDQTRIRIPLPTGVYAGKSVGINFL
jgi:chondroitin AC lyase